MDVYVTEGQSCLAFESAGAVREYYVEQRGYREVLNNEFRSFLFAPPRSRDVVRVVRTELILYSETKAMREEK
jgi:hypothetical protein